MAPRNTSYTGARTSAFPGRARPRQGRGNYGHTGRRQQQHDEERGQRRGEMQLFVKTLSGTAATVRMRPTDTIDDVKKRVQEADGPPLDQQMPVYGPADAGLRGAGC